MCYHLNPYTDLFQWVCLFLYDIFPGEKLPSYRVGPLWYMAYSQEYCISVNLPNNQWLIIFYVFNGTWRNHFKGHKPEREGWILENLTHRKNLRNKNRKGEHRVKTWTDLIHCSKAKNSGGGQEGICGASQSWYTMMGLFWLRMFCRHLTWCNDELYTGANNCTISH